MPGSVDDAEPGARSEPGRLFRDRAGRDVVVDAPDEERRDPARAELAVEIGGGVDRHRPQDRQQRASPSRGARVRRDARAERFAQTPIVEIARQAAGDRAAPAEGEEQLAGDGNAGETGGP